MYILDKHLLQFLKTVLIFNNFKKRTKSAFKSLISSEFYTKLISLFKNLKLIYFLLRR